MPAPECFTPPPDPQVVGLYITACASGTAERGTKPNSVSTIERPLAATGWNCALRGMPLERKDRAIATVMTGIRNRHAAPPRQNVNRLGMLTPYRRPIFTPL